MSDCTHPTKVYTGERFHTLIPQWPWVCADCLAEGKTSAEQAPGPPDPLRAADLLDRAEAGRGNALRRLCERKEWSNALMAEGNISCDCDQAYVFAEAGGEPPPESHPCGYERYQIDRIVLVSDGIVLWPEVTE